MECLDHPWVLAFSILGHWVLGWLAYVSEQELHRARVVASDCVTEIGRDTFENEGDDRKEAKLDALLRKLDPEGGDEASLDQKYQRQRRSRQRNRLSL